MPSEMLKKSCEGYRRLQETVVNRRVRVTRRRESFGDMLVGVYGYFYIVIWEGQGRGGIINGGNL